MERVGSHIYAETHRAGCNHGIVVTGAGVVMIDAPQEPPDAIRWREEIAPYGTVQCLIQTEPHLDHTFGNGFFPDVPVVVSHEKTRDEIIHPPKLDADSEAQFRKRGIDTSKGNPALLSMLQRFESDPDQARLLQGYQLRTPNVTFTDEMSIHTGSHTIRLIHLPGHTLGQTGVHIVEEGAIFTGDLVFNQRMPLIQAHNAVFTWIASLRRLEALDVQYVVPGHGEVGGKDAATQMRGFLEEIVATVQAAMERGWTRAETIARVTFIDRYPVPIGNEAWAQAWQERNIGWTYDELKGRGP